MDELISPKKAAKMLGVSITTLRNWENDKKIKCVRTLGGHRRFRFGDIQKILERNILPDIA